MKKITQYFFLNAHSCFLKGSAILSIVKFHTNLAVTKILFLSAQPADPRELVQEL